VNFKRAALVFGESLAVATLWPSDARAQYRHGGGTRVAVGVGFGYGPYYPPFVYSPFYGGYYGWWSPAYPYPYPYYSNRYAGIAEVRLELKPRNAQVFVDGYYVGVTDDFDGWSQRLDLPLGEHEIVVYLNGYRAYKQHTFFRAGQSYHFKGLLEPLAAGEPQEPPPQAPPRPAYQGGNAPRGPEGYPPQGPPEGPGRTRPMPPRGGDRGGEAAGFGTLALRVQPQDAAITIDNEKWDSPEGGSRLQVELPAGPHRIEVRKDGFQPYVTTVQIRPGETQTLNIALPK
jgi:hypothetical protein